jgi:hypothetical protein
MIENVGRPMRPNRVTLCVCTGADGVSLQSIKTCEGTHLLVVTSPAIHKSSSTEHDVKLHMSKYSVLYVCSTYKVVKGPQSLMAEYSEC